MQFLTHIGSCRGRQMHTRKCCCLSMQNTEWHRRPTQDASSSMYDTTQQMHAPAASTCTCRLAGLAGAAACCTAGGGLLCMLPVLSSSPEELSDHASLSLTLRCCTSVILRGRLRDVARTCSSSSDAMKSSTSYSAGAGQCKVTEPVCLALSHSFILSSKGKEVRPAVSH